MHTHARHVPNSVGAPSKKISLPQNEFQTQNPFTKSRRVRGVASQAKEEERAYASSLLTNLGALEEPTL
jgi:hypothetical protein